MSSATVNPPFGVGPDGRNCHKLVAWPEHGASLKIVDAAGDEHDVACAGVAWHKLTATAEADWNGRLAAKGFPAGRMPAPAESVLLHHQFGRELHVLFAAVSCSQEATEGVRLWLEATPTWRKALWEEIARLDEGITTMPDIYGASTPQIVLEALRKRAPDGQIDPERAEAVDATRRAAMKKIKEERQTWPTWKAAARGVAFGRRW